MSDFLETSGSLAIVLVVNLLLLGAILAGGLSLVFRFIESVSPRLRYVITCTVFLLAIALPFTTAIFKTPLQQPAAMANTRLVVEDIAEMESIRNRNNFSIPQNQEIQVETSENNVVSNSNILDKFISFTTDYSLGIAFSGLWIVGIAFLFYQEAVGFWQMRKARKSWTPATDEEREFFDCPANVPLYFDEQQSPGTIGLLRPVIVLPKHFPSEISIESKRFIVQHELAHAKWRDPLGKFLLRIVRNLFWISPALWLIENLADAEREAAADRAAIASLSSEAKSETDALSYAETLLTVAKAFSPHHKKNWKQAVGISSAGSELEMRVRRLLSSSQTTRAHIISAIAACLLTGTIMSVIPLAAFSEIAKKSSAEHSFVAADNDKNVSTEKDMYEALLSVSPTPTPRPASARSESKSDASSKPASVENQSPSENTSTNSQQSKSQNAVENNAEATENSLDLARKISEEDAKAAELRKLNPLRSSLGGLEPFPAKSQSLSGPMTTPDASRTPSQETEESARQKTLSEADSNRARVNRAMPPDLPKRTDYNPKRDDYNLKRNDYKPARNDYNPKRTDYDPRYIPYPASRSSQ